MNMCPSPTVSTVMLAMASKLAFRVVVGARGTLPELGVFVDADTSADQPLRLAAEGGAKVGGRCEWALDGTERVPFVVTRTTYNVLHEGEPGRFASEVLYQGRAYRIQAQWDGHRPVAQAVLA